MAQILKNKQQQLQQQKVLAAVAASSSQSNTMQNLSSQVFAQAIQQAGTSGTQVATLVKAGGGRLQKTLFWSTKKVTEFANTNYVFKDWEKMCRGCSISDTCNAFEVITKDISFQFSHTCPIFC